MSDGLATVGMLAIGVFLVVIPEPATTLFGALLLLAAFGLEDEAPT